MNRDRVTALLGSDWTETESALRSFLVSDVALLSEINGYVIDNSGKMLRPMMCLLMAKACGQITRDTHMLAAATELLHNATLLHDDVADKSKERRGKPTVTAMAGPSAAVLTGDFWLARAVEAAMKAGCSEKVFGHFSRTLTDLAEGEMLQLEKAGTADTTEEEYFRIIECKTGSLFIAAGVSGAISAGAPEEYVKVAENYSRYTGMAFQIKDDILDYVGGDELGKPLGVDILEQKITLPLLCAMKGSPREAEIREMVRGIGSNPSNADVVRDFVLSEGGIEKASQILNSYIAEAVDAISCLPPCEAASMLAEIAEYNAIRNV